MESGWSTKGRINDRVFNPGLYDFKYYVGGKADLGIQFPPDSSYLNRDSHYKYKFIDTLHWIANYLTAGKLLDVGSGPTHLTHWAKSLQFPFSIISCDISREILKWALENNGAIPVVSFADTLPFRDNSFDGVLLSDVLEHMNPDDSVTAVCEAQRVLDTRGWIFINIPNRITWSSAAKKDQGHIWLPTIAEMQELLITAGFSEESIHYFTRGFPFSKAVRRLTQVDFRFPAFGRSIFICAQKQST